MLEKHFFRLLIIAALADWLVSRSLARVAIFIPKSPVLLTVYQGLIFAGQYASVLVALLSLMGIGLIAWQLRKKQGGLPSAVFAGLGLLSLALLMPFPNGWLRLLSLILVLGVIIWLGWIAWNGSSGISQKSAVLLPFAAVWVGSLYHAVQSSYSLFRLSGPPAYVNTLFNLGELLVLLTPFCLWWLFGKRTGRIAITAYAWGLFAAILFMTFRLVNPAMAGILAIWSTGLTLFLPAPLYAAALGVGVATVIMSRGQSQTAGWALLLLACAGYAPQISSQIFLSLIALSMLANVWRESVRARFFHTAPDQDAVFASDQDVALSLSSEHGRV